MSNLKAVEYGYGRVQYVNEVKPIPKSSKTTGNVTVNNMGSPGVPAHFATSFILSCEFHEGGVRFSNIFNWDVVVVGFAKEEPYSTIEAECARRLAPMFRELSDVLEKQVAAYDARGATNPDHSAKGT